MTITAVSFGGGTNSAAMVIGMFEQGERPDYILFADTGGGSCRRALHPPATNTPERTGTVRNMNERRTTMDAAATARVEFARLWEDQTWDTEVFDVPIDATAADADGQAMAWCDANLRDQAQYRKVVLWVVYSLTADEGR